VRDVSVLKPSDEVEFDVIATEVVEQSSAAPKEDRNQVDLHLVDVPGSQERLGRARPMDHDRPVPGSARVRRAGPSQNKGPLVRSPINRPSSDAVSSPTGTHPGVSGLTGSRMCTRRPGRSTSSICARSQSATRTSPSHSAR